LDLTVVDNDGLVFPGSGAHSINDTHVSQRDYWRFYADELLTFGLRLGETTDPRTEEEHQTDKDSHIDLLALTIELRVGLQVAV
jgi:hypothetical protein